MDTMNLQPHLGRFGDNYKPEDNMNQLVLAKVIKVHHKNNTADVMIVKTNDSITSSEENEGKYAARIAVSTGGFDRTLMSSSGVIEPIQEGQLVILAFLDGLKNQPVILGSLHDTFTTQSNVLPNIALSPKNSLEEYVDSLKYLRVFPSQLFTRVDGAGGVEVSHPSKSFFKIDNGMFDTVTDEHGGFDHENLAEKDPATFHTRSGRTEEAVMPVSMMLVHRDDFDDAVTKWTKFFLDKSGMFRVTRDGRDSKLSYQEVSAEGDYTIRRQLDSDKHEEGQRYTEAKLGRDGAYKVLQKNGNQVAKVEVGADGKITISHENGKVTSITIEEDNVSVLTEGNIKLQGNNVAIVGNTSIQGNLSVTGTITMGGRTVATVDQLS